MDRRLIAPHALLLSLAALAGCEGVIEPAQLKSTSVDPASMGGEDTQGENGPGGDPGPNGNGGGGNGGGDAGGNGGPAGEPNGGGGDDPDAGAEPPVDCDDAARAIGIGEVALYQGVKVSLIQNGAQVAHATKVVAGRAALVRVFVQPEAGFASREVLARLTLTDAQTGSETLEQRLTVSAASSDATLASTFNFDLPPERVRTGTTYSVTLHETSCATDPATPLATQRAPSTGDAELAATGPVSGFRVVLVPVRYQADGSNRVPAVDEARVNGFRDHLLNLFPVNAVDVAVRAPMDWDGNVQSNGNGWSQLLDQCISQRRADGVDPSVYYYCMFNPDADFGAYCRGGCVAGLGFVPFVTDDFRRGAIGLGFGDAAGTMAHELGHALGLPHAPCGGVEGADPQYPYAGGAIGSWGYDRARKQLLAPDNHTDLMGYCDSAWISDYNYRLIFDRLDTVLTAPRLRGTPVERLSVVVDADLSLQLGNIQTLPSEPSGEALTASYLDAAGQTVAQVTGQYMAVTHVAGGIIYLPTPPAAATSAVIEGFGEVDL